MLAVCEVFHVLSLCSATRHPAWLAVHAVLALITLGCLVFGLHLQHELRALDDSAESLITLSLSATP